MEILQLLVYFSLEPTKKVLDSVTVLPCFLDLDVYFVLEVVFIWSKNTVKTVYKNISTV